MSLLLSVYVTCVVVLYIKFLVATGIQAIKTFDAGARPPEDKDLPLAKGRPTQNYGLHTGEDDEAMKKAKEVELRWKRIIMNDLESIPLALIVFGAGLLAPKTNEGVHVAALIVYTVLRCFHTYAYANSLQPHRAMCWRFGVLAILVGGFNAMVGAYRS
ncbi:hypothetical protein Poli38472_001084 [Pythium oligandrum]|uniref:Microsomal glutathione S-transferase 1 n=1 Tax=Pythium oligandrum TaxID=41045 RepID=A0A8K1CU04_PYTOL|nr:hypothetical protein Poli38472_001084 [Pythium oligandrum]|eukprot:TMW68928.1 hypothetical protein Poli38472_001084 [Pythium oligandrum]